jgi:hypothetical protein
LPASNGSNSRPPINTTTCKIPTGLAPGPDGIPNEVIEFLPQATRSALLSLVSLLAHKAYTPPD